MKPRQARTKLWLVDSKDRHIIGQGTAGILRAIDEEGSLNRACKKLDISYKHAWLLLKKMEEMVEEPVIITKRGGKDQGTLLTQKARELLCDYDMYIEIVNQTVYDNTFWEAIDMKISARNQMTGRVVEIETDGVIAKIKISIEPTTITAVITNEAVEALGIKVDSEVKAIVKATEVMIGMD